MKTKTRTPRSTFENVVQTAAYHTGLVMTEKSPTVLKCGLSGPTKTVVVRITIEPATGPLAAEGPVWDQCFVALASDPEDSKGDWAGNRCGAQKLLASLYADVILDAAQAVVK